MNVKGKIFLSIVDHKWFCIRCCKVWTLSVEMNDVKDRQKLDYYYSAMTIHTLQNIADHNHEIIHKEQPRGFTPKTV